jgi:polysaccharide biosynthesis protein PslE
MKSHSNNGIYRTEPSSGFFRTCWRHKGKIVVLPLLSIGLGLAVIFLCPRTYRSEAKLFLQVGHESVGLDPTATTGQTISLMQSGRDDEMKASTELMTSRAVIAQVVERLTPEFVLGESGPGAEVKVTPGVKAVRAVVGKAARWIKDIDPISPAEEAAIEIERHLDVSAERGSTVIVCRYEADAPELAQAILESVIDVYRQEHLRVNRNQDSLDFFVQQQDELRQLREQATARLRDAKNQLGLSSIQERRTSLEQQLHQVELAYDQAEQDLATTESRVEELEAQLADEPERIMLSQRMMPNAGADLMREQLYALRVKEKDLQARYNADHPLLAAIQGQVAESQELVDREEGERPETTNRVNENHQALALEMKQLKAQMAGLESRLVAQGKQKERVLEDLKELNGNEILVDQLELEEEVARSKWVKYTDNLEQARIDQQREASRVSNVSVAQSATLARKPVSPSKVLVGLASLLLATAGTGAVVLASERRQERIRTLARGTQRDDAPLPHVSRMAAEAIRPLTPK